MRRSLARIARLGDYLLWLPPPLLGLSESWLDDLNEAAFIREAVLMPAATWDELRAQFPNLPPAQHYPQAVRGDVATAWIREMPEAVRVLELGRLAGRLRVVMVLSWLRV